MKTLNSKKAKVLYDQNGNQNGFVGMVQVYDDNIYIDTRDGTGYDKVIKKLEPLVFKFAYKYNFNNYTFEDIKHDIIVHILEGIPKFDPEKDMKLSSFIQMRVNRRLINELRNKNRSSKNATMLNINNYSITCSCGVNFMATINSEDKTTECPGCGKNISRGKKRAINISEVNETSLDMSGEEIENLGCFSEFRSNKIFSDDIIKSQDLEKWLEQEDPRVIKIIELMCLYDYSVSSAAKQVGLTSAGANLKLKSLRRKKIVRDLFDR